MRALSAIQSGEYLYLDRELREWKRRAIEIEGVHMRRYSRTAQQSVDTRVILYDKLEIEIAAIASQPSVFDVTGVLKGLLVDIYCMRSSQHKM